MKRLILLFLVVCSFHLLSAKSLDRDTLMINQEQHAIIAPTGASYQWYYNGAKVFGATSQSFHVEEAGKYEVEMVSLDGVVEKLSNTLALTATGAIIKIYIIGDSTVCNYKTSAYPQTGWGMLLPKFFNSTNLSFSNLALGGRSSRTFYQEGHWDPIKAALQPGDYVFIQFGHNDNYPVDPARYTSVPDYKKYLTTYCNDTKAKGAIPVLVSPMVQNRWSGTTMLDPFTDPSTNYRGAMEEVATALNVAFIDLNLKTLSLYQSYGKEYVTRFLFKTFLAGEYPNYPDGNTDITHFQEMGSLSHCKLITDGIKELSGRSDMANLIKNLNPLYSTSISTNPSNSSGGLTTKSFTYPAGATLTLKTLPQNGETFQNWNNASNTLISTSTLTTVVSGSKGTSYAAIYKGAVFESTDCNGDISGIANLDECGVCVGGKTGVTSSCLGTIQGEDFCEAVGVFEDKNEGFVEEGYINFDNQLGSSGKWYLYSESAGNKTVGFRYANGGTTARSMSVSVNGKPQSTFKAGVTSSWTTWITENITLNLNNGVNEILLTSTTAEGGPNLDAITFESEGLKNGGCDADCNGVIGGVAFIDKCNVCVEGNTGKSACVQDCQDVWGGTAVQDNCGVCLINTSILPCVGSVEAETACDVQGILLENKNSGFSGEGYVNVDNAIGSYAKWIINSNKNQTATISFRYANGGTTSRDGTIKVNDATVGTLVLPPVGAWTTWETTSVNLQLVQGANTILIESVTADGLANLDLISFSEGVSDAMCLVTETMEDLKFELVVYPNPTSGIINLTQHTSWKVVTPQGVELKTGSGNLIDISEYPSGIYLFKLKEQVYHVIKK